MDVPQARPRLCLLLLLLLLIGLLLGMWCLATAVMGRLHAGQ
jgi:hypothetical protein